MAEMNERQDKPGTGRWMRVLLVVSLAVNLAVVGVVAGWALRHGGHHGHHPSRLDRSGGPLTRALSEEDRRDVGQRMREVWRETGGRRAGMRESFDALVADLRAVPFDPARVAERMREQRQGFAARFEMGQEVLIEHLSDMSDAKRAAYADRLEAQIEAYRAKREHDRTD
ncbi:periplasmic heavy metal sensor [uncultured Roseovarius sp.]|uniref:periplasmic heavy metal sensor n=1 Tax=uncultured Roseovarius sp. TaxID=293344 RepID=UPI002627192A|nr:periplasmic heavy metal sensor [uncultured Roseovarius sp.]